MRAGNDLTRRLAIAIAHDLARAGKNTLTAPATHVRVGLSRARHITVCMWLFLACRPDNQERLVAYSLRDGQLYDVAAGGNLLGLHR